MGLFFDKDLVLEDKDLLDLKSFFSPLEKERQHGPIHQLGMATCLSGSDLAKKQKCLHSRSVSGSKLGLDPKTHAQTQYSDWVWVQDFSVYTFNSKVLLLELVHLLCGLL